jgi:high-affinity iron transporter
MFAILDGSSRVAVGVTGAVGGIAVATALGYGIYRGGVRLNLARFFRVTGVLLVLVAAGLLAASVTEFAEAGIITFGGTPAADLSSFLAPGTLLASLITPFFGIRAVPSYAEVFAWVLYAVPMIWFVLRPLRSRAISPVPA